MLRSAREQVEMTRSRFYEMVTHIERFLYNFEEYMQDQFSHEQSRHMEDFIHVASPMNLLAQTTQWPQPNAKKIRVVALEVSAKLEALQSDADENGYIWTLEERMTIASDLFQLYPLIWNHKLEEIDVSRQRIVKYRKTPRNEGLRVAWKKERSK